MAENMDPFPCRPCIVLLTPPGRGAVATLLVEGPGALEAVENVFHARRLLADGPGDRPRFGRLGNAPGEEVVAWRRAVDAVEVHCHGGPAAVERVTELFVGQGCRTVDWKSWTRARHDDAIQAAALVALAEARTGRTATILLDQYQGALRRELDALDKTLCQGNRDATAEQIHVLLARGPLGLHLTRPWRVVLAGRPNVGKSSLINALLGYRRAIVHHVPGTTRDVVTAATVLDGWPIELADTAGLREGEHDVERAGIRRAEAELAEADLVVLVFDQSQPWTPEDDALAKAWPEALTVHNKCDLASSPAARPPGLHTDALHGAGIDALGHAVAARLVLDPPPPGAAVPFLAEQITALQTAAEAVARGALEQAQAALEGI